jgi:septal ring factor EnvC (AmiA/AmiB activator)
MLRGQVKKTTAQKILDQLVDENCLIAKQYNSKVYLANQDYFEKIEQSQIDEIDEEIKQSKEKIDKLKIEHQRLTGELKNLNIELTNEELENKINETKKEVNEMSKRLKNIENNESAQIPEEKVKEAEGNYTAVFDKMKKFKRVYLNILDSLSEGFDISRKELIVIFI